MQNADLSKIPGIELDENGPVFNEPWEAQAFAMVNVLGASSRLGAVPALATGRFHWYGKLENRKGRKMGHINTLGSSPQSALQRALKLRKDIPV